MAGTVVTFNSPSEMLTYLNANTQTGTVELDWYVLDKGARFTVIEETPFKVTTLYDESALLTFLDAGLAGTLKTIVPKGAGGKLTFVSLADEIAATNSFAMTICQDLQTLQDNLEGLGGQPLEAIIEHKNYTILLSGSWDGDALAIFEGMPEELTTSEQVAINTFVVAEKVAGNYSSYDSIIIPSFNDALNSYHDLLTNTTVSEHGTLPLSVKGFNGANGQMRILPMNSGAGIYPNYSLNDAHVSCFCQDMIDEGSPFRAVWSARDSSTSDRIDMAIRHDQAPDRAGMGFHNGLSGSFDLATTGTHHYHQNRTSNILNTLYLDGVSDETRATVTAIIPDQPLSFSGRINLVNLINANFSFMSVGGSLADPASHNTNVVNLLTALGAI